MRERCWSFDYTIINDILAGIKYLQSDDNRGGLAAFPGATPLDKKVGVDKEFAEMVELLEYFSEDGGPLFA